MNKYAEHSKASEARRALYRRIHASGHKNCIMKRVHASADAARSWIETRGHKGRPYRCPFCHQWHITTRQ